MSIESRMICPFCKNDKFVRINPSKKGNAFMLNEIDVEKLIVYADTGIAVDAEQCTNCGSIFLHSHIKG